MRTGLRFSILVIVVLAVLAVVWAAGFAVRPAVRNAVSVERPPRIRPDYAGTVIPPNIAPLNFAVCEAGRRFFVRIGSAAGPAIEVFSRTPQIRIPPRRWRSLLEANPGQPLQVDVSAEEDGQWRQYQSIINTIAREPIDSHICYRLIRPLYTEYRQTAVHERDLTTYRESIVLDGKSLDGGCVNCHSFANNRPAPLCIGVRSSQFGDAALLADGGRVEKVAAKFGFTAWHPSGRVAAYAINDSVEFLHAVGPEMRDVIDVDGALAYYRVQTHDEKMVPRASDKQRLETYPAWSPDGRQLYYCSAPHPWKDGSAKPPAGYDKVQYDLMRIPYDIDADQWGAPEMVLSSRQTGLSVLLPRISPDGRWLLCCMCPHGCFPAFSPASDLYLLDLTTGDYRKLDINSEFSESWHCWSSNGRWIAFSSKRLASPFTRCYLSFIDETGRAHKPFVLPQRDPEFYDSFLMTVSVPELISGPVPVSREALSRAARSPSTVTQ